MSKNLYYPEEEDIEPKFTFNDDGGLTYKEVKKGRHSKQSNKIARQTRVSFIEKIN